MVETSPIEQAINIIRLSASRMQENSAFKVLLEIFPGKTEDEIEEWQEIVREESGHREYVIPDALKSIYRVCDGFLFQWQYLSELHPTARGASHIVSLVELYETDEEAGRPMSAALSGARKLDVIDDEEYVSIELGKLDREHALTIVDEESANRLDLNLSVTEYISKLAKYRGLYGWQKLFLKGRDRDPATTKDLESEIDRLFASSAAGGENETRSI